MENNHTMLPRLRRNAALFSVFIFTIFLLTVGCNPIYRIGGDGDNSPASTVIRGTVVSTLSLTPASMRGVAGPKLPVSGADVFIETMPDLVVKSDANGGFLIGPVPPGNYRVIARVRSSDNKTYKEISSFVDAAPVNDNNAGELELKEATLKAKGKLTNPDGSPLVGVTVRIWGEDVTTDENGMFESPLMPPGTTVEFKIVSGGYQNIDLKLPPIVFDFEPNDNPPFVETTIPSSSDLNSNRNLPPTAILQSDKLRYVTGETVTFTATASDPEGKTLTYSWIKPEGAPNLNIALNNLSATWVAPAKSGIATFSFKATDPEGLETIRSVVIAVNPGLQKPIDMKPLDFDIPAAPTIVGLTAGTHSSAQSFTLTGIEAGATAEYSLDNGQTWQTYNSQVNISLPGIGQNVTLVIIARQTDASDNTSPNSESITVIINGPTPTYTVTYHANGADGDVPTDTTPYASEETFTVKNAGNLSKTGYAFAGWNTSANGNGDAYAIGAVFTIANSNVNLYAQWAVNSYTITYNLNEGTNHNDNPTGFNVETPTITLQSPTKTGYTFAGWFNNVGLTGEAITQISQGSTANVTLYAKWTAVAYTITYNLNDGTNHNDNPAGFNVETPTITLQSPTKTGYTFAGWFNNEGLTGEAITQIAQGSTTNVTLYAKWTLTNYSITYNLNEGTNHNDNPAGFNVETETINLLSPTKTGYTFAGWFNNEGLTGEAITQIAQGSTDNVTLYAKWTAVAYTITYNLNEGTNHNDNPTGFNVETPTITLQSPTKTGYTFGGWFNNEGLTGEAITQIAHGSTANVTLYAKWTAVAYTITYNLNEGTNHNDNPAGFNVETPTITLQSPTKTGYTFAGWFNNEGLTGEAVTQIAQGSTANVNLYAKWTAIAYTITYNLNEGTNHNDNPTGFNVETETINLLNPTRNSYTFAGWFNNAGLTGEAVTQIAQGSTANVTLYAKWTAIAYTITYNLNEGTNHNDNPTGFNVETETINLLNPTRNSYTFAGWFNNEGLTGEAITQIAQGSTANVTLYAKWTAIAYTITYNLNEGTNHNDNPAGFNVETPTITLQSPTKTGYTFAGWFNNAGLTGETITQIAQGSTANVTLYAKWTVIAYTITYNLNEGTNHNDNPTGFNVETLTITLQSPTKTGYTFSGWFNNAGLTGEAITQITQGSAANVTLYAKWTAIAYTITYNLNEGTNHNDNPTGFNVETATITLQNPTKNGYTFGGWFNNEGLTGAAITQIAQGSTANVTLYAKWVLINYSITYNLNEGTNHNDNPAGFNVETPTITLLNPTRANADFVAWYGNADFSGEAITQIPQGSTANVTLYAKWIIYYTVSFNNNSGDTQAVPNSKQVAQGTALGVLPASPSKNRMYFRSWNTNSSGTGTVITADSIINANTTVYAIYSHFEEGNGTAENPYHVKTPYELYMTGTSSYWSKHFIQVADIDLSHATLSDASNSDWYSSEKGWSSYRGGGVRGVYDGNNKTVSNLYMKDTQAYIGLFYTISENAIVKNLKLTNINIEGGQMVGGITGMNYGLIQNCSVSGNAKGSNAVGGLVGLIYAGSGILGTVERCSTNCTVTASIFASGGLAGHNYGSISNSHSAGTVNSTSTQAGGLAYTQGGTVTNCYSITVISDKGAGFSGGSGTITNCFWDTTVSGAATSGGGTGKTTAEMKTAATFSAWDSNIWNIQDGEYPTLK